MKNVMIKVKPGETLKNASLAGGGFVGKVHNTTKYMIEIGYAEVEPVESVLDSDEAKRLWADADALFATGQSYKDYIYYLEACIRKLEAK